MDEKLFFFGAIIIFIAREIGTHQLKTGYPSLLEFLAIPLWIFGVSMIVFGLFKKKESKI